MADEARRLHQHFKRTIPTLIITGDTTIDESVIGDFPVLRKPVQGLRLRARIDTLLAAIQSLCGQASIHRTQTS